MIELLVVVSIIALLIAVLLPALAAARKSARLAACGSNLRQIGIAVISYAADNLDRMPSGPETGVDVNVGAPWNRVCTSQVWIGDISGYGMTNFPQRRFNSLGKLLENRHLSDNRAPFCPGDDTTDPTEELAKINTARDAFSSYLGRQLDETTRDRLSDPGTNSLGKPARMLAMDRQTQIPGLPNDNGIRSNHENRQVSLLFLDGHVANVGQLNNRLAIGPAFLSNPPRALDRLVQNADHAEAGRLDDAPNP